MQDVAIVHGGRPRRTHFITSFCESCIAVPGIRPSADRFPGQSFVTQVDQFQQPYQPRSSHRRDLPLRRGSRRCQPRLSLSAFTTDATVDLSPLSNIGLLFPASISRDTSVEKLLKSVGPLDSTHHVSNFRVSVSGNTATLTCCALAQYFRTRQGSESGAQRLFPD
jgi:hypothetical protein